MIADERNLVFLCLFGECWRREDEGWREAALVRVLKIHLYLEVVRLIAAAALQAGCKNLARLSIVRQRDEPMFQFIYVRINK